MFKFCYLIFSLFIFCSVFRVEAKSAIFTQELLEAENAYDQGNFKEAVFLYEALIEKGLASGDLLFNLGNSYFRAGEKGKSVAAYLAAKRKSPRDPDIKQNLKHAHSFSKDKLSWEENAGAFSILSLPTKSFTGSEVTRFFLVFWFFSGVFLIATKFVKPLFSFRSLGFFLFLFFASFFFYFSRSDSLGDKWGAVIAEIVKVRSGPGETNALLFEIHEGAPVLIRDEQKEWYRIELSDAKKGWLKREEVAFF